MVAAQVTDLEGAETAFSPLQRQIQAKYLQRRHPACGPIADNFIQNFGRIASKTWTIVQDFSVTVASLTG